MGREAQQQQQQQVSFTVEQLVAVNPYNPDILPDLENYVNEQVPFSFFLDTLFISLLVDYRNRDDLELILVVRLFASRWNKDK